MQTSSRAEGLRKQVYGVGAAQTAWCTLGLFLSFSFLSNILGISAGAIACQHFATEQKSKSYFSKGVGATGCGDAVHIKGLQIAIIVFSILDALIFGAVAATVGAAMLLFVNNSVQSACYSGSSFAGTNCYCFNAAAAGISVSSSFAYAGCYTAATRSLFSFVATWLILAVVFPIGNLILASVSLCYVDGLMSAGAQAFGPAPGMVRSPSSVTIIQGAPMMQPQPVISANPLGMLASGQQVVQLPNGQLVYMAAPQQPLMAQPPGVVVETGAVTVSA